MSGPRVSVVVPVYNRAHAVRTAAASVLGQTYRDFELILVDDGSTDDSGQVIEELTREDVSRVRCVHQQNAGAAAARNRGIAIGHGEYVCFLDSDDEWLPRKLEVQVEFMDRHPDVGLSYVWALVVDDEGRVLRRIASRAGRDVYRRLFYRNAITPTSGTMVRSWVLDQVGVFDTGLRTRQDWDLWLRIARCHRVREVRRPLVRYRSSRSGISADLKQTADDNQTVLRRALQRDRESDGPMHRQEKRVLAFLALRVAYRHLQAGDHASFRRYLDEVLRLCPTVLARHPRVAARCLLAVIGRRR